MPIKDHMAYIVLAALDKRIGVAPAPATHGAGAATGFAGAAAPAVLAPNADRKSTRLNSSHSDRSRMPSSA